jgi:hypothetical protein
MKLRALCLLCLLAAGCGSDDDGGQKSCAGLGTLQLTVGPYEGTSSVSLTIGSAASTTFTMFADACTGNATGNLHDIPSAVGTHSFTEPMSTGGTSGPYLTLGVPDNDYTIGFDSFLNCAPCGTGTITITESDATRIAGVIDATAWKIVGTSGGLGTDSTAPLAVTGSFETAWE